MSPNQIQTTSALFDICDLCKTKEQQAVKQLYTHPPETEIFDSDSDEVMRMLWESELFDTSIQIWQQTPEFCQ